MISTSGQSVSERPFPTSQSLVAINSIWEMECIREAIPNQPEQVSKLIGAPPGVYQRGHSQPARANSRSGLSRRRSVSERPFPTSQSRVSRPRCARFECIREAIPNQPELSCQLAPLVGRVYQRGHSQPARALTEIAIRPCVSVSERPFPTSQSAIQSVHIATAGVYQRGHSQPARAVPRLATARFRSVSERPFPTSQSRCAKAKN